MSGVPLLEAKGISRTFGAVRALADVSLSVSAGEVHCLLGDNGAGKSTLIKVLSGVHAPSRGRLYVNGQPAKFASPRDALDRGIATVFQDLGMIPMMSVARNFFLGREPVRPLGPLRLLDRAKADSIALTEMSKLGIAIRDPGQPVGTLSGGQRQCVAIARAIYFGARVLILDEPTSALGVTQTELVLTCIKNAQAAGIGVIFITHNVRHAYAAGDRFTVLSRGRTLASTTASEISRDQLQELMSGAADYGATP